jgi:hypothetical protein
MEYPKHYHCVDPPLIAIKDDVIANGCTAQALP